MPSRFRRQLPLLVMLLAQLFIAGASMLFFWSLRPELLSQHPSLANGASGWALSSWLLPVSSAVGLGCALAGGASRGQRSKRMQIVGIGLTLSGLVFVGAALATFSALLGGA